MKLVDLEIFNIRGIVHLKISPDGKNFVVYGPNGSGKSAIVDAVDFLLTGQVTRLTGKGTKSISLFQHGPHIDHKVNEAIVKATVVIDGIDKPISLERRMDKPAILIVDKEFEQALAPIIDLAEKGQHVLTRRDILRFVAAEAGDRSVQIQDLLNITTVETNRKTLIRVVHELETECKGTQIATDRAENNICPLIGTTKFDANLLLNAVNTYRATLGGSKIDDALIVTNMKIGLTPPGETSKKITINPTLLAANIDTITSNLSNQKIDEINDTEKELMGHLSEIISDEGMRKAMARQQLYSEGLGLIDETGSCPLCESSWAPGELKAFIDKQIILSTQAQEKQKNINGHLEVIKLYLQTILSNLIFVQKFDSIKPDFQGLIDQIESLNNKLLDPYQYYLETTKSKTIITSIFDPRILIPKFTAITCNLKDLNQKPTPEQEAWDVLTKIEVGIENILLARSDLLTANAALTQSKLALRTYTNARDVVLDGLYKKVKDRFVGLYKKLHGTDEKTFNAELEPSGAALNFVVDFHGRGTYPPQALHSEGHQDSMGLCLYLSLSEYLTNGLINLTILDDVVMSVDADHRRNLCELLSSEFPNRQFLITTHDRTWKSQLELEGVVDDKCLLELFDWTVTDGPKIKTGIDCWSEINAFLLQNDISSAASRLRNSMERLAHALCEWYAVEVPYKADGAWDLGELMPRAIKKYKDLLRRARESAISWGNQVLADELELVKSTFEQSVVASKAENWAVNPSIHYNNWNNLTKNDFTPISEAFYDLYRAFRCSNCDTPIRLNFSPEREIVSMSCKCTKVSYGLQGKPKASTPFLLVPKTIQTIPTPQP